MRFYERKVHYESRTDYENRFDINRGITIEEGSSQHQRKEEKKTEHKHVPRSLSSRTKLLKL